MEMRNLRQRFGAFVFAAVLAAIVGNAAPLFADMGGPTRDRCAFVAGLALKVPGDSVAADFFRALYIGWDC
jgi:hypothetical protein